MVVPLKSKYHKYKPTLVYEYLIKSKEYLVHSKELQNGEYHPGYLIGKLINPIIPGYQLNSGEPKMVSQSLSCSQTYIINLRLGRGLPSRLSHWVSSSCPFSTFRLATTPASPFD